MINRMAFGILAGGKSSRMGCDKKYLMAGRDTFLERILAAGCDFEQRIVSLGSECDADLEAELGARKISIVRDEVADGGPLEGIRCILRRCERFACLIVATDMPCLTRDFITRFEACYRGTGNLVLTNRRRREPLCSIYDRKCLSYIDELRKQGIARPAALFKLVPTEYKPVEELTRDISVIWNINRPEDYNACIKARHNYGE